jgi:hypothetical protein
VSDQGIPDTVRAFILSSIDSIEQLEVLLLLRKHATREWTVAGVSAIVKTNPRSIAARLVVLHRLKLVAKRSDGAEELYTYAPDPVQRIAVDGLAQYYAYHSTRFVELIYSKPIESARLFAEAFRLRKSDED